MYRISHYPAISTSNRRRGVSLFYLLNPPSSSSKLDDLRESPRQFKIFILDADQMMSDTHYSLFVALLKDYGFARSWPT